MVIKKIKEFFVLAHGLRRKDFIMTNLLIRIFIKDRDNINNYKVRQRYGLLSGIVGIFCNIVLFVFKFLIGIIASSVSVTADAFNNLSDAGSSIVTLVGFKMASRPADKNHPFGHGRIEYISGLIVSLVIILMGIELTKSSIENIFSPEELSFNKISLFILLGSIVVKLWMFLFNHKISKKIESTVMKASALDSLSDVITTVTVIISMLVTKFTGMNIDGYAGLLVSFFIIATGLSTAKETINPLIGTPADSKILDLIEKRVLSYENVTGVHDILIHNYGPSRIVASLHIEVPYNTSFIEAHSIADSIEKSLNKEFSGVFLVHTDPVFPKNEERFQNEDISN